MLLINKNGRLYDVPDTVANEYVARDLGKTREAIGDMLSTLRKPESAPDESSLEGCCNAYANYCPNR
jgi:hypothetical protein